MSEDNIAEDLSLHDDSVLREREAFRLVIAKQSDRKLGDELKLACDRILNRNENLESQLLEVRRENEELSNFTHILAHDLRAPIKHLHNLCKMIQMDDETRLSPMSLAFLTKMEQQSSNLHDLINNLRELSKQSLGALTREAVDLNDVLDDVMVLYADLIEEKKAQIHREKLDVIQASPPLMWQLFDNLFRNALKHGAHALTLDISSEKFADQCRIVFCNTAENAVELSESYFNFGAGGVGGSTGIGLFICKRIVDLHGGVIEARSTNTQFEIHITLKEV